MDARKAVCFCAHLFFFFLVSAALHLACMQGDVPLARCLMEHGARLAALARAPWSLAPVLEAHNMAGTLVAALAASDDRLSRHTDRAAQLARLALELPQLLDRPSAAGPAQQTVGFSAVLLSFLCGHDAMVTELKHRVRGAEWHAASLFDFSYICPFLADRGSAKGDGFRVASAVQAAAKRRCAGRI